MLIFRRALHLSLWTTACLAVSPALAQGTPASTDSAFTFWGMIEAAGYIGWALIAASAVALALVIEHLMSIRPGRLVPAKLAHQLEQLLAANQLDQARQLVESDTSLLGRVAHAGLKNIGAVFGYFDMQNAMQEVAEREVSGLYRKLEYLSFIAAAAPMLGLLGTVVGMIDAFHTIEMNTQGASPSELAGGISKALVTTCMGLIVAIPSMFFVSYFRNSIDSCVAQAETVVERLMGRFRQGQSKP